MRRTMRAILNINSFYVVRYVSTLKHQHMFVCKHGENVMCFPYRCVVTSSDNYQEKYNQMKTEVGKKKKEYSIKEKDETKELPENNSEQELRSLTDMNMEHQTNFLKNFQEEENINTEEYTTVKILKGDGINKEFISNNEQYINFLKSYNEEKKKNHILAEKRKSTRFSNSANMVMEQEEKSLWQILKEKEDEIKKKKKLKSYHKELNNKMKREREKIKKEEKYFNEAMSKVDENVGGSNKKKYIYNRNQSNEETEEGEEMKEAQQKKKPYMYNYEDAEDIDSFLQNDRSDVSDIKSYDEVYQGMLNSTQENRSNKSQTDVIGEDPVVNEKKGDIKKGDIKKGDIKKGDIKKGDTKKGDTEKDDTKKGDTKKGDIKKEDEDTNDKSFNVDNMIYEDFKTNVVLDETGKYKKYKSSLLDNDLDNKESDVFEKSEYILFSNENDDPISRRFVENEEVNDTREINNDQKNTTKKDITHENGNMIEVKTSDVVRHLCGENIETIVNSNIDNLIIQREIKKEKNAHGIITIMYNNLNNCDCINLSTGIHKISKVVDIYQKQSITKNYMFLCIIKKLEEKLSSLDITNLVQIFYAFVKLQHLPFFFDDIINRIIKKIQTVEPKQMCNILYTLSNILIETVQSKQLKNEVIQLVKINMHKFVSIKDIICLLTSLSKLKFKEIVVYYELSKKIEQHIEELTMKNVSNILWAFSNINYTCKLVKKLKKLIEKNIHEANHLDIVNIIYSLTKLNEYDDFHLYNEVFFNAINIYIHNMSVKNLCIIMWCYIYAGIDKPELYINILTKVNENMKNLSCKDIVSILSCLSKMKYNYKFTHLCSHLKNKVMTNIYAFTPLQLTHVLYNSSFLDIKDHKYYFLLIQQIYQIRRLLYFENWTLILYALKNVCYLNVHHLQVFQLIQHILTQVKHKYRLLSGEDCVNIFLILNELEKYTYRGYFSFNHLPRYSKNDYFQSSIVEESEMATHRNNQSVDLFDDDVKLNELSFLSGEEEIYFPHLYDLLYEQIKIRLNNYWKLSIKDVNNLLLIMKNCNIFDNTVINMILRQIVPVLLKCTNIEFLIFLSNVSANKNFKSLILTHLARRPKLVNVFRSKVNSITQHITNNVSTMGDNSNGRDNDSERIYNEAEALMVEGDKLKNGQEIEPREKTEIEPREKTEIEKDKETEISLHVNQNLQPVYRVDVNSCISLVYACFNIHYEDDNILKLYDIIEHIIIVEKKRINTFMLINFLYVLTVTNNKMDLVKDVVKEYMNFRYGSDIEESKQMERITFKKETSTEEENEKYSYENEKYPYENENYPYENENHPYENELTGYNKCFHLFSHRADKFSSYAENGDEEMSLVFLKLAYINIILNYYNFLYHLLCEVCKYKDEIYSDEFINLAKQVCYHIYNFTNFFYKTKNVEIYSDSDLIMDASSSSDEQFNSKTFHLWHNISEHVSVTEDAIFLDLPFEKSCVNLINKKEHPVINPLLKNNKISKNLENNINIANFFYYILNYNEENVHNKNWNTCATKKEKRGIKIFHFDHIITDILNFLNIEHRGSYVYDGMYKICCSFPYERHLIDLLSYEDVLFPSNKPLLSSELRQKHLALKGWTVHSLHFRDLYNSIKDQNVICYIFNICKKIKKELGNLEDKEKILNEKTFWENIKYANIL